MTSLLTALSTATQAQCGALGRRNWTGEGSCIQRPTCGAVGIADVPHWTGRVVEKRDLEAPQERPTYAAVGLTTTNCVLTRMRARATA